MMLGWVSTVDDRSIPKIYSYVRMTSNNLTTHESDFGSHKHIPLNENYMYPQLNYFFSIILKMPPQCGLTSGWLRYQESQSWRKKVFAADWVCIFTKQKPCTHLAKSITTTVEGVCVGDGPWTWASCWIYFGLVQCNSELRGKSKTDLTTKYTFQLTYKYNRLKIDLVLKAKKQNSFLLLRLLKANNKIIFCC